MSIKFVRAAAFAMAGAMTFSAASVVAQGEAKSLDELLSFVKKGQVTEAKENRAREQRFAKDRADGIAGAQHQHGKGLVAHLRSQFRGSQAIPAIRSEHISGRPWQQSCIRKVSRRRIPGKSAR